MDVGEVDAPEGIGGAESVEEGASAVGLWEKNILVLGDDVSFQEAAEVCLYGIEVDFGGGAGVGVLWPPAVLAPEDVGLDAGGHAASTEGLSDDVSGLLLVEVSSEEGVGDLVLVFVEYEGDGLVGVVDVEDIVFRGSPKREVILLAEFVEGFPGGF